MKRPVPAFILSFWLSSSLVLAAGWLSSGCGGQAQPGPQLTFDACAPLLVLTDPAVTSQQAQGVEGGLTLWNQAAGTALSTATAGSPADAAAPATGARVPLHFQSAAAPFFGLYDGVAGMVFINSDLVEPRPLSITIAHELGHAFGLQHVPPSVRPSLMNPGNITVEPTPADVATLAALWGRCAPAAGADADAGGESN